MPIFISVLDADCVVYVDADTVSWDTLSWDKMSSRAPVWANNKTKFITRLMFQEKTISWTKNQSSSTEEELIHLNS